MYLNSETQMILSAKVFQSFLLVLDRTVLPVLVQVRYLLLKKVSSYRCKILYLNRYKYLNMSDSH